MRTNRRKKLNHVHFHPYVHTCVHTVYVHTYEQNVAKHAYRHVRVCVCKLHCHIKLQQRSDALIVPMPKQKGKRTVRLDNIIMDVNLPRNPRGASIHSRNSLLRFPNLWDDDDGFAAKEKAYAQTKRYSRLESKTTTSSGSDSARNSSSSSAGAYTWKLNTVRGRPHSGGVL